jgi:hypothetical protein
LITAYTKDWKDGTTRIRIEKQEYPKKSLAEALEEKLYIEGEKFNGRKITSLVIRAVKD